MEINTVTLSGTVGNISTKIIDKRQCSKFTLAINNGTEYIRVVYWSSIHSELNIKAGSSIVLNGYLNGTDQMDRNDIATYMAVVVTENIIVTSY